MPLRIEDYALIGDCETAALVGRDGSIDWLCWPRFDSDACFAALLGKPENGRWLIAPRETRAVETRRQYRGDTLILETTFNAPGGSAKVVDFMPRRRNRSDVIRLVVGLTGSVDMRTELEIRFGYGTTVPWVHASEPGTLQATAGPDTVLLRTPVALQGKELTTVGEFTVSAGETYPFVLTYQASYEPLRPPLDPREALRDTEVFWKNWADKAESTGPWSSIVTRSLITLKALTYAPSGGIVAAPTTSLPEHIGSARNWDYRYCWVRDATLTLLALMNSGFYREANEWRGWLMRAVAGTPETMQIMYGIAGERRLTEWEVPWLSGYENSTPVRIGNAAHEQLQLDVYGELMDALYQARRGGLEFIEADWDLQCEILRHLETVWRDPDEGIWEVRGDRRHFTYSKVMAWTAFDRGVRSIEEFGLPGPLARWREIRRQIHDEVCKHGYDASRGTFVRSFGSSTLDASLLLLPAVGFLPPEDPRIQGTIARIERELLVDGYVLRYRTDEADDGLPPGEGAFLACSFWLADAYVMLGRMDDARRLFDRLAGLVNDLGLLSEEYDPSARRMLGNFPQAFSHVALINTAHNLSRVSKPVDQRADRSSAPGESTAEVVAG
jgi:GH15 family glucan-1,4-alpha-glucosidase